MASKAYALVSTTSLLTAQALGDDYRAAYVTAYADVVIDRTIPGMTDAKLSATWSKAGVRGMSRGMVYPMATAHELTRHGVWESAYVAAILARDARRGAKGVGLLAEDVEVALAHRVILSAVKGRDGREGVKAVLADLAKALGELAAGEFSDDEAYGAAKIDAVAKAVDGLLMAAGRKVAQTPEGPVEPVEPVEGEESEEAEEAAPKSRPIPAMNLALEAGLARLDKGESYTAEEAMSLMATMARVAARIGAKAEEVAATA
jgi:hypothetical protein